MISIESEEINFELSSRFTHVANHSDRIERFDWRSARRGGGDSLKIFCADKIRSSSKTLSSLPRDTSTGMGTLRRRKNIWRCGPLFPCGLNIYDFITFQEARSFSRQVRCARVEFSEGASTQRSNPIFTRLEYFGRLRRECAS